MAVRLFGYLFLNPIICVVLLGSTCAWALPPAGQVDGFYEGARARAMGNAFVAIADDEESLYLNPAGLANMKGTTFTPLDLSLEGTTQDYTAVKNSLSSLKNITTNTLDILMGEDIYMRADYTPSLIMKNFGIGFISDQQFRLFTENKSLPQVQFGIQSTNGIQVGYGMTVMGAGKKRRGELKLGIAVKMLYRRGGFYDLSPTQIINISEDELKALVGNYGQGYGVDLGAQYIYHLTPQLNLQAGSSYTDVGNTTFSATTADPILGNLSIGGAIRYDFNHFGATLSYEYSNMTQSLDARMRNHIGMEIDVPIIKIYAGMNEIWPTYGARVDLGIVRVTATSYEEEISSLVDINPEHRYLLNVAISF